MKKILAVLLVLVMVFSFVACGGGTEDTELNDDQINNEQNVDENGDQDADADTDTDTDTDADADVKDEQQNDNPKPPVADNDQDVQAPADETVAQILLKDFNSRVSADSTTMSLAEGVIANPIIQFFGGAVPMEVGGYLPGLGEGTITGYKECTSFGPMMGSIAFIGYVFELEDGVDAAAFEKSLLDNADPRWQICVTADETVVDTNGNFVFFLMAPAHFDEAPVDEL